MAEKNEISSGMAIFIKIKLNFKPIYNINNQFSNFFLHLNTTRFENFLNLDRKKVSIEESKIFPAV